MKILNHLLQSVRDAAVYNPEIQVAPACILWPDKERQWETIIPALQTELPELIALGEYAPEKRTGPAIWLRCVLAGRIEGVQTGSVPIIYLPGVSRQDLRATTSCPEHLKPLAELQYRGVIWSQINAKDWTVLAYLKSDQGGLGLDVAQDNETRNAMLLALHRFIEEDVQLLKGKRLDKDYFNTLLTGGDPIRDVLQWLDHSEAFRAVRDENQWQAFVSVCKSQLVFNPHEEGALAGCERLAHHEGAWQLVWERFCEAPRLYPHIPAQIRKCSPPTDSMLWHMDDNAFNGWPQWNEEQEKKLRQELLSLDKVPPHDARSRIGELEKEHGRRRSSVWAELEEAPLAQALEHLALIAQHTAKGLAAGSVDDLAVGYRTSGWQVDDSVLRALSPVKNNPDYEAVETAIRTVYLPWAEDSARYLQELIDGASYPGGTCRTATSTAYAPGDCVLFVDGLRFDAGKRLAKVLGDKGLECAEKMAWSALPSVTATGKAAVTPVREMIRGEESNAVFEPVVAQTGQAFNKYHLKKLLTDAGWIYLDQTVLVDEQSRGWCEFGDIDQEGHHRGWRLAQHLDGLIRDINERITGLLADGWKRVHVVTDHGWLLMPGGLPKIELPSVLADNKWGRCASLKPGASTQERLYPWYWNPSQHFVLANGVGCFKSGQEYTHGGLSLQECLTLQLTVTGDTTSQAAAIEFAHIAWKGLRCTVTIEGAPQGLNLDVRTKAGDSSSSVVIAVKPVKEDGVASVVVEDEDKEGQAATVVLLDANGTLVAQTATVIGGDNA